MVGPHGSMRPRWPDAPGDCLWLQSHRGDERFFGNVGLAEPAPSVHPSGEASTTRAIAEVGWRADFRIETDSKRLPLAFAFARFGIPRNRAP
jgi:hypothetical protein